MAGVQQHGASARSEYHEHTPSPRLAAWVGRVVGYRIAGFPAGIHLGMPSGTVTLVIPLDEPLVVSDAEVPAPRRFDSVVAGLATAPAHIHHNGNQHGVQLALRPGAIRALFGVPPSEVAETSYELTDVMGRSAAPLRERLHETSSWAQRFALVEEALLPADHPALEAAPEVAQAWQVIRGSAGAVPIHEVARSVGWSMRHLQQRFRAEFGITPKEAARVSRFERSLPLVSAGRMPLATVAARCGYADQAHLNRDWRDLAGTSPTRWLADDVLIAP